MKKSTLALAVTIATLAQQAGAAGFIEDSTAKLDLRNFYYDLNSKNTADNTGEANEWGQGFIFNYQSGFTEGTVGVGVDVIGLYGLRLDSGGRVGKADRDRNPGALFPLESDGSAVNDYSKAGATAKFRLSKTELRLGTLQPKLPVVTFNDGRLLPQLFDGGQVISNEIDGLTLTAGQLEHTKTRSSTDDVGLRIGGAARPTGTPVGTPIADTNKFYFAGGDYKITKDLTAQYYYGNLEDFYKQHFLGLVHNLALPAGSLKTDLRYFDSSSDGKNGSAAGRAEGYLSSGYYGNGVTAGEVDNQTWSALFTYSLGGHALSAGYQQVSGDSAFPFLNQGDGSTSYLITDRQIGKFLSAGERTWLAEYGYDFGTVGVPGLKAIVTYLKGDNIDSTQGDRKEWERDFRLDYTVQQGSLKGLGFSWRNASLRSSVATTTDVDENRLIVSYSLPLL
ncbi:outer membrane porin, OprD family [Pseudomonas daroniae]|uniref:Outer membrane porin, OprD family n=1 Tax=Phytopseudomonas daroniae TaxID=2487519 RepID=A0A4Q9QS64_9GAMM|nr:MULTISPECIES: OprD family porin [Pseudomonas]TBU83052.1 outer membrane porin, OprD family [Pseudomonas sp. FRB 228]TBU83935.1 outer membrane porin, OprD family [Pseudomonas daroniae]TBU93112.1 outer membrane porin, OprD family [Pseudomonas daroniae]